jgi:hypothetical protein|tara:strand:- start:20638 stop:21489 length:852 start_codon:yes stop_codon:yes gene_type:complete
MSEASKLTKMAPSPTIVSIKNNGNLALIAVITLMFIITIYVIMYIWKTYKSTSLKTVTMVSTPVQLTENGGFKNLSKEVTLPDMYNGNEFSYSFWVYVNSNTGNNVYSDKHVMSRMTNTDDVSTANPIFFIDSDSNKLYAYVSYSSNNENVLVNNLPDMKENALVIDYLPIHRWVNIVLVVDNNYIQLFMDGELRQVKDFSSNGITPNKIPRPTQGNIVAGGNDTLISFDGYLSKVQCFNYALTLDHAKIVYKTGPLPKSILAALGVPAYGVRSPFYRIDTNT